MAGIRRINGNGSSSSSSSNGRRGKRSIEYQKEDNVMGDEDEEDEEEEEYSDEEYSDELSDGADNSSDNNPVVTEQVPHQALKQQYGILVQEQGVHETIFFDDINAEYAVKRGTFWVNKKISGKELKGDNDIEIGGLMSRGNTSSNLQYVIGVNLKSVIHNIPFPVVITCKNAKDVIPNAATFKGEPILTIAYPNTYNYNDCYDGLDDGLDGDNNDGLNNSVMEEDNEAETRQGYYDGYKDPHRNLKKTIAIINTFSYPRMYSNKKNRKPLLVKPGDVYTNSLLKLLYLKNVKRDGSPNLCQYVKNVRLSEDTTIQGYEMTQGYDVEFEVSYAQCKSLKKFYSIEKKSLDKRTIEEFGLVITGQDVGKSLYDFPGDEEEEKEETPSEYNILVKVEIVYIDADTD